MIKNTGILTSTLLLFSTSAAAGLFDEEPGRVIEPDVQNQETDVAQLDSEFFELGIYAGLISIEDFGTEALLGFSANFHATEDLFIQANYAFTEAGKTIYEDQQNVDFLKDSDRKYTAYDFLVGWNVFPGEVFITSDLTYNSAFYLLGGVGSTEFAGDKNFTITWGSGYRIIFMEGLSWHLDFKDHIFETSLLDTKKTTHNLELSTGVNYFF